MLNMESNEIYHLGSAFERKVITIFKFLIAQGFNDPEIKSNAKTYVHKVVYWHPKKQLHVEIINAYHPVDYGFEINLSETYSGGELKNKTMVFNCLKEDQRDDLSFLEAGASALHTALEKI